jgi:hypothetical protein
MACCSSSRRDYLLLSVLVGQLQGSGRPSRPYLNMGRVRFAAEDQSRTILRGSEFYVGRPLGIDQAKQDRFWVICAIRQDGRWVQLDACSNSSLVVSDFERATSEHRSDAIHLDRSGKKAEPQEAHLDLRQQKHQESEIENAKGDKKSLNRHDLPPGQIFI